MPSGPQLQAAVGRNRWLDAIHQDRELRPRLQHVEFGRGANSPLEILAPTTEGIGQAEQDAADLDLLLLFEGDDVVVDFNGAERLEKETGTAPRTAMDDAGDRRAVFRSNDENVPSIPVGHDLLLQVFRRVLAAQIRLERAAKSGPLLAKPLAQILQLGARIIEHLAAGIDLATHVRDFMLEGRRRVGDGTEDRHARGGAANRGARAVNRGKERRERQEMERFERAPLDRDGLEARI